MYWFERVERRSGQPQRPTTHPACSAWFQARCRYATCPAPDGVCVHYHYDVVDTMRTRAIRAGAIPIEIRDFGALITARRAATRQTSEAVR
jgi:hypothetical protein